MSQMQPPTVEELAKSLKNDKLVTLVFTPASGVKEEFKVQRALLVNASPWFKSALTGRWKEAQQRELPLHDVELDVVEQFLHFLIRREIQLPKHKPENETLPVRLWVFADRHLMPKLQNEAMKYMFDVFKARKRDTAYPSTQTIAEALENSTTESALHKYMFSLLLSGVHSGSVFMDGPKQLYCLGKYNSENLAVLEGIPGVMVRLLWESRLRDTDDYVGDAEPAEYLVPEQ